MSASTKSPCLSDYCSAWKYVKPFVLGGSAGCWATLCIQPVDRIKTFIQAATIEGRKSGFVDATRTISAREGVAGFYKGLSAGCLRQLTYGTTRLGIFRTLTNHFTEGGTKKIPFSTTALCSLLAGGIGALVGNPADVALIRMQTQPAGEVPYKSVIDCMRRMYAAEGVRSFFTGATPTIIRALALNLGMLSSYDHLKEFFGKRYQAPGSTPAMVSASVGSGIIGATMCLPLDLIKTRMQKGLAKASGNGLPAMFKAAREIYAQGGVLAFYSGYVPFLLRVAPHIVITWLTMEFLHKAAILK